MQKKYLLACLSMAMLTACGGGSSSNNAPVFSQSSYQLTIDEDTSATLPVTATDADGDTLSYSISNQAQQGVALINASSGQVTYTPRKDYNGTDSFQVMVSDGKDTRTTTVTITILPVNDAPVFTSTEVYVTGSEIKTGQIQATDVDGDTLTYTLITPPQNGTLTLDSATGAITYTLTELVDVNDIFTVKVSDGNGGEVTQQLTLRTNLHTNADRAYYYYASEHSHLKKAENLIEDLADDISKDEVYISLAKGYALAALDSQTTRILEPGTIVNNQQRAEALLAVATEYNQQQRQALGDTVRQEAQTLYATYLATKGVKAFNGDDAVFYKNLAQSYTNGGNKDAAFAVYNVLDTIFSDIMQGDYNTYQLRAFFAFRDSIEENIPQLSAQSSPEERATLLTLIDRLYSYASKISYQVVSNDKNGNLNKPYYAIKLVALQDPLNFYITLGDTARAKAVLADILALYAITGIDSEHSRTADPYAATTTAEYPAGLANIAGQFVELYPYQDISTLLDKFEPYSTAYFMAQSKAEDGALLARVKAEADPQKAFELVKASKDEDDLRLYFTNLVAFNTNNKGAATIRLNMQDYAGTEMLLQEATQLIKSPEYVEQNLFRQAFVTGNVGCHMILKHYFRLIAEDTTNSSRYTSQAQDTANTCVTLAQTHYKEGNDGEDVEIADAIKANSEIVHYLGLLNMPEQIDTVIATAETNLGKYSADDMEAKRQQLQNIAYHFYQGNLYDKALQYYSRAIEQVNLLEANAADSRLGYSTTYFFDAANSDSNYRGFLLSLNRQAGKLDNYPQLLSEARGQATTLYENTLQKLSQASTQAQLSYVPRLADDLLQMQQYDKVQQLSLLSVLGAVQKHTIVTDMAKRLATQDDFPGSRIASVDTDKDGKPNFFAAFATAEQIAASGLELDNDSDNDGVDDTDDLYPLDPTRH